MQTPDDVKLAMETADQIHSAEAVQAAYDRMAAAITARLEGRNPLVLAVLNGGLIPAGHLLTRLAFPLQAGYLHASRYRGATRGAELHWIARPSYPVEGRTVLVIDDIFDEGHTLKAIVAELRAAGASEVLSAVLIDKRHERKVPGLEVDFIGLDCPDRYLFGCGMDYHDYLRNLPGIYALKE